MIHKALCCCCLQRRRLFLLKTRSWTNSPFVNLLGVERLLTAPEMHLSVGVYSGVSHRLATLGKEDFHLVLFPAHLWEVEGSYSGEEFFAGGAVVHAYQTHDPVLVSILVVDRIGDLITCLWAMFRMGA